nr:hypothetical protein [Morchella crassipes]
MWVRIRFYYIYRHIYMIKPAPLPPASEESGEAAAQRELLAAPPTFTKKTLAGGCRTAFSGRRPPLPPFPLSSPPPHFFFEWGGDARGGGKSSRGGRRLHLPPLPTLGLRPRLANPPSPPWRPRRGPPWVLMGTPQHSSHPAATQLPPSSPSALLAFFN